MNSLPIPEVDLTQYPLTSRVTEPYFRAISKEDGWHIYEGTVGANRYRYFVLPKDAASIRALMAYLDREGKDKMPGNKESPELKAIIEELAAASTETVTGLDAYWLYWKDLSEEEKWDVEFISIPHFEALKEYYEIWRRRFVKEQGDMFMDKEIEAIELEKAKQRMVKTISADYLVFKGNVITSTAGMLSSAHAKELARFHEFLITGKADICVVPFIGTIVSHHRISPAVLDAYYRLVPQPRSREEISEHYKGPVDHYFSPYSVNWYGAYLLKTDADLLDYRMANLDDPAGYHKAFDRPAVWSAMKQYAKGFQAGFDNFMKDKIERPEILIKTDEYRIKAIYEYVLNPWNRPALSEQMGRGEEQVFSNWLEDGRTGGYFYCAWYYILQNYWIFEPFFAGTSNAQRDPTASFSAAGKRDLASILEVSDEVGSNNVARNAEPSDKTHVDQIIDWFKNIPVFAWIIVVAGFLLVFYEFVEKTGAFWAHVSGKDIDQANLEAKMVVRKFNDSTIHYDFEISNSGKGAAKYITASVMDEQFCHRSTMRPLDSYSTTLNTGTTTIVPGNPADIYLSSLTRHFYAGLLVEYLDGADKARNCVFYFDMDRRDLRDQVFNATRRNCGDSLASAGRLDVKRWVDSLKAGISTAP